VTVQPPESTIVTSSAPDPTLGSLANEAMDPRVARSRTAIMEAAAEVFLERGYSGARMGDIARRAGVARRTVFNVHGDKDALFLDVLGEAVDTAERFSAAVGQSLGESTDPETDLRQTGLQLARAVLGGRIIALRRLLITEVARLPDLACDYYERAPGRVMRSLADAFTRLSERGLMQVDNPVMAAEQFAFLVMGASMDRALFEPDGSSPSVALVEARAAAGVDAFLRAYPIRRSREP
jgi:TetR/AcrR family transcriptional regulator, mexJK operon transcriptional repressor